MEDGKNFKKSDNIWCYFYSFREVVAKVGTIIFGTLFIIYSVGHALAMPFYWYYKLRQHKMNKSMWPHDN